MSFRKAHTNMAMVIAMSEVQLSLGQFQFNSAMVGKTISAKEVRMRGLARPACEPL